MFRPAQGRSRHDPPAPNEVLRRSAVWARGAVVRAAEAVRRRGAPLSIVSPAAAVAACAASRGPPVVHPAYSSVGRARAHPPSAPSALRDSGDTTHDAARARSTECRTGSTPGSPDQPNADDDAGRGTRAATPTQLSPDYPQFPQVYPQRQSGYYCLRRSLICRVGPQLWITLGG